MYTMVLIAQCANTARFEDQARVVRDVLADPPSRQRSKNMSVGDYEDIVGLLDAAFGLANRVLVVAFPQVGDESIETFGDLLW